MRKSTSDGSLLTNRYHNNILCTCFQNFANVYTRSIIGRSNLIHDGHRYQRTWRAVSYRFVVFQSFNNRRRGRGPKTYQYNVYVFVEYILILLFRRVRIYCTHYKITDTKHSETNYYENKNDRRIYEKQTQTSARVWKTLTVALRSSRASYPQRAWTLKIYSRQQPVREHFSLVFILCVCLHGEPKWNRTADDNISEWDVRYCVAMFHIVIICCYCE